MKQGKLPKPGEKDYVELYNKDIERLKTLYLEKEDAKELFEIFKQEFVQKYTHPRIQGPGIKVITVTKQGSISWSKVPHQEGVDLEQYRGKPSTSTSVIIDKKGKQDG